MKKDMKMYVELIRPVRYSIAMKDQITTVKKKLSIALALFWKKISFILNDVKRNGKCVRDMKQATFQQSIAKTFAKMRYKRLCAMDC
jgi:hypothetical protein